MTACVKNHSRRVALAVSASLVGALSLGAATVPAFAADITTQADTPADVWDGVEYTWSADKNSEGDYQIEIGDQFVLEQAETFDGHALNMSNITVFYFRGDAKAQTYSDALVTSSPSTPDTYYALVINGRVELDGTERNLGDVMAKASADVDGTVQTTAVAFKVVAKSLQGSEAFQGVDTEDSEFKYTGNSFTDGDDNDIHFKDAEGNVLTVGEDVSVTYYYEDNANGTKDSPVIGQNVIMPGDYYAVLTAVSGSKYQGSAQVHFSVDKIDLSKDVITIAPVEAVATNGGTGDAFNPDGQLDMTATKFYVNGEPLNVMTPATSTSASVNLFSQVAVKNGMYIDPTTGELTKVNYPGSFAGDRKANLTVTCYVNSPAASDFFAGTTASQDAQLYVVGEVASGWRYDGESITGTVVVNTAAGEKFDPSLIKAVFSDRQLDPTTVTVTKGGQVVTDYSQPGVYTVTAAVEPNADTLAYGGTVTFTVDVRGKRLAGEPKVYVSVDGKDARNAVEYDGNAVEPVVVVKAGGTVLVAGDDYTVTYADEDGNVVESMVEPGEYTGTVSFGNAYYMDGGVVYPDDVTFTVTIDKATVRSAKPDQDVYAYADGAQVNPTFTAWTKANFKGLSVAVDPAEDGVTYYECALDTDGKPYKATDGSWAVEPGTLTAADLTEEGWYVAEVSPALNDPHFQGTVQSEPFQVSTYAAYADVDANAWYAQDVYNAREQGYMTGIAGTNVFMPEANISRGEIAQVFFNMAGVAESEGYNKPTYVPTKFGDVDSFAWYAEPIAWASNAGVVTGYLGTDSFGPNDTASREQVAAMIYRYAAAQGKDTSVQDADAALAAYTDGAQVSDWAKTAMAWCVENGVFGQNTTELKPQDNIQRAQVAAIAVRVQPEKLPAGVTL